MRNKERFSGLTLSNPSNCFISGKTLVDNEDFIIAGIGMGMMETPSWRLYSSTK